MARTPPSAPRPDGYGDVFADAMGAMIVHVQRERGVAHRTFVLKPSHVRLYRVAMNPATRIIALVILLSWGYLAVQAVRVPLLTGRIARMQQEAVKLDTLQRTLTDLQARYDQVQEMLSRSPGSAAGATTGAGKVP